MHQGHKAVKVKFLLAAHGDFGVQMDRDSFWKSYGFLCYLSSRWEMHRCILLMLNAFVYFAGDGCD